MRTVRFPLEIGLAGIILIGVLLGAAMAKPIEERRLDLVVASGPIAFGGRLSTLSGHEQDYEHPAGSIKIIIPKLRRLPWHQR